MSGEPGCRVKPSDLCTNHGVGPAGRLLRGPGWGTSHFFLPLPGWVPGRRARRRSPGPERAWDRAPGAGFRVSFNLTLPGAAGVPRSFLPCGVPAQGVPRRRRKKAGPRDGETQSRGERESRTHRDREAQSPGDRVTLYKSPDPHTQVAAGRAEVSVPGAVPQGPQAPPAPKQSRPGRRRAALPRGWRGAPRVGGGWAEVPWDALTEVHLLVAFGALGHGGAGSGAGG